jgi:hypothetical protein
MKQKNICIALVSICLLVMAVAFAQEINATEENDIEDWLIIEPEEKICDVGFEDWLCISGCNSACAYAEENNETLEQNDNVTKEGEYYPWKASDFEDKDNLLHIDYFMREPLAATAVIAFVRMAISKERVKDVLVYKNLSFGLDETAEQYYAAILQVHNETGFDQSEYPPSGLTIEQTKEIFYIDTDEKARSWLSKQHNWKIGRLYYYILLGTYHNHSWLHPEDAGSAIAIMKDAESIIKIDRAAYQLATLAYFHGIEVVYEEQDLPTDELEEVERILEKAKVDESETLPMPTPARRFDYWKNI